VPTLLAVNPSTRQPVHTVLGGECAGKTLGGGGAADVAGADEQQMHLGVLLLSGNVSLH